jgi:dye decolorizing peroxidase
MAETPVSRRRLLAWAGTAGTVGAVAGVVGGRATADTEAPAPTSERLTASDDPVSISEVPQGLDDHVPAFGHLLALDLLPDLRRDPAAARQASIDLLTDLGRLADAAAAGAGPGETGIAALDLRPDSLQVTPGVGATLLDACGLADQRPEALLDLPTYPNDRLDPQLCGGDLFVQLAAEDPMKLAGVVQEVAGLLAGRVVVRYSRRGFRTTQAGITDPAITGRNLMGHRDGTANPPLGSPLWESTVLAREPGSWMDGGSYLVLRQIRIDLDDWFAKTREHQEDVIGRSLGNGAALGAQREADPVDLDLRDEAGDLLIPGHAHVRLANPRNTGGSRIYRRGWNYDDGWAPDGSRDAGLLFVAWQSDLRRGFLPIQRSLVSRHDALNDYTTHVGSAVFAVPGRRRDEAYAGQRLLEG